MTRKIKRFLEKFKKETTDSLEGLEFVALGAQTLNIGECKKRFTMTALEIFL